MVVPAMGADTIRLPKLWLPVAVYVLAIAVHQLTPAIDFNGPTEHKLLIGVPMSTAFILSVAALFCIGFVSRRFEMLAVPLLAVPLMILLADVVRSVPTEFEMAFEEPLYPVDKALETALTDVLPYNLILVALGVLAGRRLLAADGERSLLPPVRPFAIIFAALLILESLYTFGRDEQRNWFSFFGVGELMTLVEYGVLLSLFIVVFLLNSGWAVIPTLAIPFAVAVTTRIESAEFFDVARDWIPYTLVSTGIFVLLTLALSAWCRETETQPDESDGPNAINSTRLPAGSET